MEAFSLRLLLSEWSAMSEVVLPLIFQISGCLPMPLVILESGIIQEALSVASQVDQQPMSLTAYSRAH